MKNLNYVFSFGKHKGATLAAVLDDDVRYVRWCMRAIKGFVLDEKAFAVYCEKSILQDAEDDAEKRARRSSYSDNSWY